MSLNSKKILRIVAALVGVEFLSYLGYLYAGIRPWTFFAIAGGFLILSFVNFRAAFFIMLLELFIGSKGYLFYLDWGGIHLPVRMALFLIIIGVWAANLILKRTGGEFFKSKWFWPYLILGLAVMWGVARGIISGNQFSEIFFDANAYFYLALVPIFYHILKKEENRAGLLDFLFAGAIWISLKTLILLFIVSHVGGDFAHGVYRWVRTTGVGEITDWGGGFFRIFIQSQLYAVFALLILLASDIRGWLKNIFGILFFAAIFVSFSRSFEVGLIVAVLILFILKIKNKNGGFKWFINTACLAVLGYLLAAAISGAIFGATISRISISDSAASTRIAELRPLWDQIKKAPIFGSGLGTTLTFKSEDPRVTTTNPTGMYTTSAFEWGYLDILMKLGIIGMGIYLYLIWKIGRGLWLKRNENYNLGLFFGFIALLIVNIFSPYLNHPLGIGFLMILTSLI